MATKSVSKITKLDVSHLIFMRSLFGSGLIVFFCNKLIKQGCVPDGPNDTSISMICVFILQGRANHSQGMGTQNQGSIKCSIFEYQPATRISLGSGRFEAIPPGNF